jgi:hypothetical protein
MEFNKEYIVYMKKTLIVLALVVMTLTACAAFPLEKFTAPDETFSVKMPTEPTTNAQLVNSYFGFLQLITFESEYESISFIVAYSDYPPGSLDVIPASSILLAAREGIVASQQGTLERELLITIDDTYQGRDFEFRSGDGLFVYRFRIYLVGNRLYRIGIAAPAEDGFPKGTERFLDSFKLITP